MPRHVNQVACTRQPPRLDVTADELADGLVAAIEGGFVLARGLRDPALLPGQLRQFRNYLELLFGVEAPAAGQRPAKSAAAAAGITAT